MAVNPAARTICTADEGTYTVSVINGRTNTVTTIVRVGTEPTGVAVNQGAGTVYVTNFNDGTVPVITN